MVLEEVMTYMRNPLKYYNQKVKLPRVLVLSSNYIDVLLLSL